MRLLSGRVLMLSSGGPGRGDELLGFIPAAKDGAPVDCCRDKAQSASSLPLASRLLKGETWTTHSIFVRAIFVFPAQSLL